MDLCRQLREWSAIPLIVLSAIDEEHHKVRALNAGADDYVTKPFTPHELVARVRATLRRAQGDIRDQRIEIEGGLAIDLARRAVYRDGREVHLTPIEFSLLGVLLRDRGRLHTHASLLRQVWGPGHVHDVQLLRTHIANLRRKLASPHIRTLHGVGYRFEEAQPRVVVIPGQARSPARVPDLAPAVPGDLEDASVRAPPVRSTLRHSPVGVSTAPAAPPKKHRREQPLHRSLHVVTSALDRQVDERLRPERAMR